MARAVKKDGKESTLQQSALELKENCTYPECGKCQFLCEGWGGYGVDCRIGLISNKYIVVAPKNWNIAESGVRKVGIRKGNRKG